MTGAELARRFVAAWYGDGDVRELLADDYVHHTPGGDLGVEAFVGQLALVNAALADVDWRILHVVEQGDRVAVYAAVEATHAGDFFGVPATGRRVSTVGACFMRIAAGRIAEDWDVWALQSILHQLA